jgi:hypothetical protein
VLRGLCLGAACDYAAAAFGGFSLLSESTTGGGIGTTTDSSAAIAALPLGFAAARRLAVTLRFAGAFFALIFFFVAAFLFGAAFFFIATFFLAAVLVFRLGAALRPALRFFAFAIVISIEVEILARRHADEKSRSLLRNNPPHTSARRRYRLAPS